MDTGATDKIQAGLQAQLPSLSDDAKVRVVVSLKGEPLTRDVMSSAMGRTSRRTSIHTLQDNVLGAFARENNGAGLKVLRRYSQLYGFSAELTPAQIKALAGDANVEAIEEMRVHYKFDNESHPLADIDLAHSTGYTGSGAVIAIIDDGIDHDGLVHRFDHLAQCQAWVGGSISTPTGQNDEQGHHDHAAFGAESGFPNSKFLGGYDFADFDSNPTNDCSSQSHGTAVAGIYFEEVSCRVLVVLEVAS